MKNISIKLSRHLDDITISYEGLNHLENCSLSEHRGKWTIQFPSGSTSDLNRAIKILSITQIGIDILEKLNSDEYDNSKESLEALVERFNKRILNS